MKAVWLTEFGGPEVLVERDTADPVPGPDEVLIQVAAVSITFVETLVRAGRSPRPGGPVPPYIPGNGVGGIVIAVGPGVDAGWQNARVVGTTGGAGGYAELAVAPVAGLVRVPDEVDIEQATALLADGRTATGLVAEAAPRAGEWALVEAAAGGVGSLLVQLCAAAGARVIAAAGGPRKAALAAGLGAEASVDYRERGWTTGLPPVDLVFDGVGGEIGAAALATLRPGGRFVQFGLAGGTPTAIDRADVTVIGFDRLGLIGARAPELAAQALNRAARGTLRALIGQTFPLDRAADAHRAIEARETIGKTLLIP